MFLERVIHFGEILGDQVDGHSPKELKSLIVVLCSAPEYRGSILQYDPNLISVVCSQTELSISGKIWETRKESFTERAKIVNSGSLSSAPENTRSKLQYDPDIISVVC